MKSSAACAGRPAAWHFPSPVPQTHLAAWASTVETPVSMATLRARLEPCWDKEPPPPPAACLPPTRTPDLMAGDDCSYSHCTVGGAPLMSLRARRRRRILWGSENRRPAAPVPAAAAAAVVGRGERLGLMPPAALSAAAAAAAEDGEEEK